jgi:integrase
LADTLGKLTDTEIKKTTKAGYHADGGGLYLAVSPRKRDSFSRSWVCRYTAPDGRRREMGLGSYPEVSLAAARRAAALQRDAARTGVDPIAAKRQAKREAQAATARAMTFRECAEAYITSNEARWRSDKHGKQWRATLKTYAYPVFSDLFVSEIDTALVTKALDPIWSKKPETARRLRGRVEAVLDWATVRGHRAGPNPARWRGHLDKALAIIPKSKRVQHLAALPFDEIGAFMSRLRSMQGVAPAALELAILTACRTSEVTGAQWREIDLERAVWTIPADRMKAGRDHRIPLSKRAVQVLRAQLASRSTDPPPISVFPGTGRSGLSNMALLMTLRRMSRADITVHGFRSTFRDWAAERTNYSREVAEAALAHTIGDAVEEAYRRGDLFEKRRRLMQAWADYCDRQAAKGEGEVVKLKAKGEQ